MIVDWILVMVDLKNKVIVLYLIHFDYSTMVLVWEVIIDVYYDFLIINVHYLFVDAVNDIQDYDYV